VNETPNLAEQLANSLRDAIRRGDYEAGCALPSERNLCETYQLSRTTVRRALRILEDQVLVQRVAGSGTYVRGSQTFSPTEDSLGLILPGLNNPYYADLADAIEQEASRRGYNLIVGRSQYQACNEADYLLRLAENRAVKGVLAVPCPDESPMEAYHYVAARKPLLCVSRWLPSLPFDSVIADRVAGGSALVRHLIGLAHREIAYVRGTPPQVDQHHQGYLVALSQAGIPAAEDLFVSLDMDHEQAGEEGVRVLLQRQRSFTAIFARNDLTAVGVLRALAASGLRVPEDVSVAGYDNTRTSAHLQPPLTTIDNSTHEMGRLAVTFLLDRVERRWVGPARHVVIEPALILRASTAPRRLAQSVSTLDVGPSEVLLPIPG
jgi:DNA-binding LacI/PurR family transcriptional regulator